MKKVYRSLNVKPIEEPKVQTAENVGTVSQVETKGQPLAASDKYTHKTPMTVGEAKRYLAELQSVQIVGQPQTATQVNLNPPAETREVPAPTNPVIQKQVVLNKQAVQGKIKRLRESAEADAAPATKSRKLNPLPSHAKRTPAAKRGRQLNVDDLTVADVTTKYRKPNEAILPTPKAPPVNVPPDEETGQIIRELNKVDDTPAGRKIIEQNVREADLHMAKERVGPVARQAIGQTLYTWTSAFKAGLVTRVRALQKIKESEAYKSLSEENRARMDKALVKITAPVESFEEIERKAQEYAAAKVAKNATKTKGVGKSKNKPKKVEELESDSGEDKKKGKAAK